jgi:hypothetical protein
VSFCSVLILEIGQGIEGAGRNNKTGTLNGNNRQKEPSSMASTMAVL